MQMTAGELIRDALILAHVEDPEDEQPSTKQTLGLRFLNQIITRWGALPSYIPYFSRIQVPILPNVSLYTLEPVITQILEANIVDGNNCKAIVQAASDKQYNTFDFVNVSGIPRYVYLDKVQVFPLLSSSDLGSNIYVFPTPNASYTLNLAIKYQLQTVTLFEQLLMFPPQYLMPLEWELAKRLIRQYGTVVDGFDADYAEIMRELKAANPQDYSIQTENPLFQGYRFRTWGTYVG